jgi:hypothetical protein
MATGISTIGTCKSKIACLKQKGYNFVCRYYCTHTGLAEKKLTLSEAKALSEAGVYIISVWENGLPTSTGYFSHERGVSDGEAAHNYAQQVIGQPVGTPIYFAVDYDASAAQIAGPIHSYFQGVHEALEAAGNGHSLYSVGVYGSGRVCAWLRNHLAYVTHTWLAESPGWAGYNTFTQWNIKQSITHDPICGLDAEDNVTHGNGGGFLLPIT